MARFSTKCWNNCATCEHWLGPRILNSHMAAAEVEHMASGVCSRKADARSGTPLTYATNSCTAWREWGEIGAAKVAVPV